MIERIERLESDMKEIRQEITGLRVDMAHMSGRLDHFATHADVERMGRTIIMWNVGTLIAVAGLVFAIIRYAS